MMRFPGMNLMRRLLVLPSLLVVLACGRNETTASKSAAAHHEGQAKGTVDHSTHGAVDHSTHGSSTHGTVDHSTHATVDHSTHGSRPATDHAAMDHSAHGATTRGSAAHDRHAGMQHGTATPTTAADPHAHHRQPAAPAAAATTHTGHGAVTPPASAPQARATSAEIARTEPSPALRQDDFDAPAATSIAEARKAAGGETGTSDQAIYTCPMHPEVTSATPGSCPKCGMTLVKKEK